MLTWLFHGHYWHADHWKFPRVHFWGDDQTVLMTPHLWPDHQTRLSTKSKSYGRRSVHAGSPFGGGEAADVCIEHHKFLIKSREERLGIAQVYDGVHPGFGTGGMKPFSLPEESYEEVSFTRYTNGGVASTLGDGERWTGRLS
jgi:hypothetical protein